MGTIGMCNGSRIQVSDRYVMHAAICDAPVLCFTGLHNVAWVIMFNPLSNVLDRLVYEHIHICPWNHAQLHLFGLTTGQGYISALMHTENCYIRSHLA